MELHDNTFSIWRPRFRKGLHGFDGLVAFNSSRMGEQTRAPPSGDLDALLDGTV